MNLEQNRLHCNSIHWTLMDPATKSCTPWQRRPTRKNYKLSYKTCNNGLSVKPTGPLSSPLMIMLRPHHFGHGYPLCACQTIGKTCSNHPMNPWRTMALCFDHPKKVGMGFPPFSGASGLMTILGRPECGKWLSTNVTAMSRGWTKRLFTYPKSFSLSPKGRKP